MLVIFGVDRDRTLILRNFKNREPGRGGSSDSSGSEGLAAMDVQGSRADLARLFSSDIAFCRCLGRCFRLFDRANEVDEVPDVVLFVTIRHERGGRHG